MTSDTKHTNLYVWIGVALLLAGVGYQLGYIFTPENEMDDSGLVVSQLCFLASWSAYIVDYFKLKSMELPRPHWIWMVLNWSPVYIWKRGTMLDRDRKPFWTLMGGLVLLVGLVFITAMATEAKRSYETPLVSEKHNEGHTLSEEDRQAIKQWLQSLSYEFAEAALVIMEAAPSYIILSKDTAPDLVRKVEEAFHAMQQTDFFERTAERYSKILGYKLHYSTTMGFHRFKYE